MNKTTPGKWRARITPGWQDEINIEATDLEAVVARVNGFPKTDQYVGSGCDDPKANARLIAAAPDMLQALKWVQGRVAHKTFCPSHRGEPCDCGMYCVDDAIAKAEGMVSPDTRLKVVVAR